MEEGNRTRSSSPGDRWLGEKNPPCIPPTLPVLLSSLAGQELMGKSEEGGPGGGLGGRQVRTSTCPPPQSLPEPRVLNFPFSY